MKFGSKRNGSVAKCLLCKYEAWDSDLQKSCNCQVGLMTPPPVISAPERRHRGPHTYRAKLRGISMSSGFD